MRYGYEEKKTVIFGGMILIIAVCAIGLFTQSPKWSQRSFEAVVKKRSHSLTVKSASLWNVPRDLWQALILHDLMRISGLFLFLVGLTRKMCKFLTFPCFLPPSLLTVRNLHRKDIYPAAHQWVLSPLKH